MSYSLLALSIGLFGLGQAASKLERIHLQNPDFHTLNSACDDFVNSWQWLGFSPLGIIEVGPIFGEDVRAIRVVSKGFAQTCKPALELVGAHKFETPSAFLSVTGSDKFRKLSFEALSGLESFHEAILNIDSQHLHFGLQQKISKTQIALVRVSSLVPQLRDLISLIAAVHSKPKSSQWLIVSQNLAESRGTGGLTGAYGVVSLTPNDVSLVESGSDQRLGELGNVTFTNLPIDLKQTWGAEPGVWQDLNASGHVPYAARQIYDSWFSLRGKTLDGVVFIGQGWTQNLVGLVGPINIDGTHLDGNNTADFLAKGIYSKYPSVGQKNAFVQKLMKQVSRRIKASDFNFLGLLKSIDKNVTGDKLLAWGADPEVEKRFIEAGLAGSVSQSPGNSAWIVTNNGGGNKLDAYIKLSASYTVTPGFGLVSDSHLSVALNNLAPSRGLPIYVDGRQDLPPDKSRTSGSNLDLVSVYLPIGAELTQVSQEAEESSPEVNFERKRCLLTFRVETSPGESKKMEISWTNSSAINRTSKPALFTNAHFISPSFITKLNLKR